VTFTASNSQIDPSKEQSEYRIFFFEMASSCGVELVSSSAAALCQGSEQHAASQGSEQRAALQCSARALQEHCIALQHTATPSPHRENTAPHCIALRRTAPRCNTLQHTASHYSTFTPQGTRRAEPRFF